MASTSIPEDDHARVAVLEQIAADTRQTLQEIRADIRDLRNDLRSDIRDLRTELRTEIRDLRGEAWRNFRWTLGVTLGAFAGLLATMAHGFHWI